MNALTLLQVYPSNVGAVFKDSDVRKLDSTLPFVAIPYLSSEVLIVKNNYFMYAYYIGAGSEIVHPTMNTHTVNEKVPEPIKEESIKEEVKIVTEPIKEEVKIVTEPIKEESIEEESIKEESIKEEVKVVTEPIKEESIEEESIKEEVKIVTEPIKEEKIKEEKIKEDYQNPKIPKMSKQLVKSIDERYRPSVFAKFAIISCQRNAKCDCKYPLCTRIHSPLNQNYVKKFAKYNAHSVSKKQGKEILFAFLLADIDPDKQCENLERVLNLCISMNSLVPLIYPATKGCYACNNCYEFGDEAHPFTFCDPSRKCKKEECPFRH